MQCKAPQYKETTEEGKKGYKQHFVLVFLQAVAEMLLQLVLERRGVVVAIVGAEGKGAAEQQHEEPERRGVRIRPRCCRQRHHGP